MRTARFWTCHNGGSVKLTLRTGETLHHSNGGPTQEGYRWESNEYSFDGTTVTCEWTTDERDCDGRMTRAGFSHCTAGRLSAGYHDHGIGIRFPDWQASKSIQRDYSAEAMGY